MHKQIRLVILMTFSVKMLKANMNLCQYTRKKADEATVRSNSVKFCTNENSAAEHKTAPTTFLFDMWERLMHQLLLLRTITINTYPTSELNQNELPLKLVN